MRLQDLVTPTSIVAELESTNRAGVVRELVDKLADAGRIAAEHAEAIAKSILTRERTRGSTGFGKGVAIPHTKVSEAMDVVAAVGRSSKGIDFAALDGAPVHAFFLIVSSEGNPEAHLRAMDVVFRSLQSDRFRKFFRQSDTPERIYDLLKETDEAVVA